MVSAKPLGETPRKKGESIAAAPTYAAGNGWSGWRTATGRCAVAWSALDAKTGEKLWTVHRSGSGRVRHDTWPKDNDIWTSGGAGVWLVSDVDADLGMV